MLNYFTDYVEEHKMKLQMNSEKGENEFIPPLCNKSYI